MKTSIAPLPRLLTIREAAAALRVCTKTVYRLIKDDTLPVTRVGKQLRISERTLRAYIARTE